MLIGDSLSSAQDRRTPVERKARFWRVNCLAPLTCQVARVGRPLGPKLRPGDVGFVHLKVVWVMGQPVRQHMRVRIFEVDLDMCSVGSSLKPSTRLGARCLVSAVARTEKIEENSIC